MDWALTWVGWNFGIGGLLPTRSREQRRPGLRDARLDDLGDEGLNSSPTQNFHFGLRTVLHLVDQSIHHDRSASTPLVLRQPLAEFR